MHDFKKLDVWHKSRILVANIYRLSKSFPKEEIFGLTSQIKRSAISIPSNIAEGCGRRTNKQLAYHLQVALGSCYELETQIVLAQDIGFLTKEEPGSIINHTQEVAKMLNGLIRKIEKI